MKRWIWEQNDYPNFSYDLSKLTPIIEKVSLEQGYLNAMMQTMTQDIKLQRQSEALIDELISTSAIEGEILNRDSVKASIAKKFGFDEVDYNKIEKSTDNLLEILIDANTNYEDRVTLKRIFGWHNALFEKGYSGLYKINVAQFRGDETMRVVGGGYGKEKVFYEAPPRDRLEYEMDRYLEWFNNSEATLIKAAISHLWFVIIHPFDDGNGRIARALTDIILSKIEQSNISRLYSFSNTINLNKKSYYQALERTTGYIIKADNYLDITIWCEWFLNTLYLSLIDAKKKLNYIFDKTNFWDKNRDRDLNIRQIKVLNFILDIGIDNFKGTLSKKKYMSISGTSPTTASRDLSQLVEYGCIKQVDGT